MSALRPTGLMDELQTLRKENRKLKEVDARATMLEAQLAARAPYKPQLWPTPQP